MIAMQEFSSVIASSYDAESLAPMLTEKASEGWSVVSIISAGTNVVAYLTRDGDGAAAPVSDAAEQASDVTSDAGRTPDEDHISEIEVNQEAAAADEAAFSPSLPGTAPAATDEPVSSYEAADDASEEPSGWGTADDSVHTPVDTPSESDFASGSGTVDAPTLPDSGGFGGSGGDTTTYDSSTEDTHETMSSGGTAEHAGAPVDDGFGQGSIGDSTSGAVDTSDVSDTSDSGTGTSGDAGTGDASGVPAGWYADPSGRFELRYWDGNAWTEHVSRAGQQYTDPPVA